MSTATREKEGNGLIYESTLLSLAPRLYVNRYEHEDKDEPDQEENEFIKRLEDIVIPERPEGKEKT